MLNVFDNRKPKAPTFKEVGYGEMFTDVNSEYVYIKMRPCECEEIHSEFNAVGLDGDVSWFEDDEE